MYSLMPVLIYLHVDAKVQKRPLLRPSIPSPYAGKGSQKVVYLSMKTPFMSAFKRVKQILNQINKRYTQGTSAGKNTGRERSQGLDNAARATRKPEEVIIRATGRAIEKALNLALFFQKQDDYCVKIRTGSVDAVDDIVQDPKIQTTQTGPKSSDTKDNSEIDSDQNRNTATEKTEIATPINNVETISSSDDLPESRVRHASMIEVAVYFADRTVGIFHGEE